MIGIGCSAGGIDGTATPSGIAGAEKSIVTISESESEGRGRDIVEANCIQCHGPDFLPVFQKPRSEWLVTIDRMLNQYGGMMSGGASALTITPEEREILADYLASNFGPDG